MMENLAWQTSQKYLIDFSITTNPKYEPNWHHREIANALEAVERGEIKRLMIFMPPRHGKSQLATINFPVWYLGKHPDHQIITVSYSGDLAVRFGSKARDLITSGSFQKIFNSKLKQASKSKEYWETEQGGSYTSSGLGGAITGKGADLLIIDDPIKNKEEAESDIYRNKVWDYYTSTLYTRLEKDASIILILTRWHTDDLAGRLLEKAKIGSDFSEEWEVIEFPAIAVTNEKHRRSGEPLWKDKYPINALKKIRETIGLMDWSSLYQQQPRISELQEFKEEYFRYYEEEELYERNLFIDILIDPAVSKRDEACNTGVVSVAHETTNPKLWVMDDKSGRYDPYEVAELVFSMVDNYKRTYLNSHVRVWIETEALQNVFMYIFKKEMQNRKSYFVFNELPKSRSNDSKDMRIRGLIPLYRNGQIFHRPYMKRGEMEMELVQFPVGKFKDRIDALSYKLSLIHPPKQKKRNRIYQVISDSLTGW